MAQNIYFNQAEGRDILKNASSSEKYIIAMNSTLQQENKELRDSLTEANANNEELQSEVDSNDKAKVYMKGILKNFVEMDLKRRNVCNLYTKIISSLNSTFSSYKKKASYHLRIFELFLFLTCAVIYETMPFNFFFIIFTTSAITVSFQEATMHSFIIPTYVSESSHIKELLREIKVITDAQDFIHERIDCI
jgi:hypothetical protein